MPSLNDAYSTYPAMATIMGDTALLRHMARFEGALAHAQAEAGLVPAEAATVIAEIAASLPFDEPSLFADAVKAGTLAIPFVKSLTAAVRTHTPSAAPFMHFGATSQDVIDSALVLQLGEALVLIDADLTRLAGAAAGLARLHRNSAMLGRTLLQPATPTTFGLKAAQWLSAAMQSRTRVRAIAREALVAQFGGAAGTLGSLGAHGAATAAILQRRLADANAYPPARDATVHGTPIPWHTRRGALISLASELAIATGIAGKIARDISLMMQYEVAETFEPSEAGRGGSSAMPHKRNPVRCMLTVSAALRTPGLVATLLTGMVQEHERALGGWQAEWGALPELVKLTAGALANMADTLDGLQVDVARMRANFEALKGLPMTEMLSLALAPGLGRAEAFALVEAAAKEVAASGRSLGEIVKANTSATAHLSPAQIDAILDPLSALGATQAFIDTALDGWAKLEA
ncbi:MAG: 3-carboxy-cis,cis-muconate cycloisomerase [Hyphomicrobiales bacterium]|nr:3-carboxy-cis,cis-muconate cycloisomerase [Hyphomicrobiales bacterium]